MRHTYKLACLQFLKLWASQACAYFVPLIRLTGTNVLLSAQSVTGPLMGRYSNTLHLCAFFISKLLFKLVYTSYTAPYALFLHSTPLSIPRLCFLLCSAYHIPTFCAALYWAWIGTPQLQDRAGHKKSVSLYTRIISAGIPLSCLILFVTHSVGSQAPCYAAWWIIPALSALIPHRNQWIHALASTLVMHSLGSVLWLSLHDTTPLFWSQLIPLAIVERLLLATSIHATMSCIEYTQQAHIQTLYRKFRASLGVLLSALFYSNA